MLLTVAVDVAVAAGRANLAPVLVVDLEDSPVVRFVLVLWAFGSRVVAALVLHQAVPVGQSVSRKRLVHLLSELASRENLSVDTLRYRDTDEKKKENFHCNKFLIVQQ